MKKINNIPPYAEEITINSEIKQIQEILNKFKQPIPSNFKKLEQLNWMCSTQGWKEPVCERYGCLVNGEWKQIDIRHSLLEKLGLEAKNIPYPVHISPTVLDKGLDHYFAYNVEDEKEIFLDRPLTIHDLPITLQRWKNEIETLKEQVQTLEREKVANQQAITTLTTERDDYQIKWDISLEELEQKGEIINNLPQILEGETLNSLLERPTLEQLQIEKNRANDLEERNNALQREKNDIQEQRDNRPNITLNQWNNDYSRRPTQQQLTNLQTQLNSVRTELNNTKNERDNYFNRWNSHTCSSCSRPHCGDIYSCQC